MVPPEIPVGAAELEPCPAVRIVAATATGFDHLDLEAIAAAGAWATHCPGYCDEEVAEHAVAFSLDLLRGLTLLDRAARAGEWNEIVGRARAGWPERRWASSGWGGSAAAVALAGRPGHAGAGPRPAVDAAEAGAVELVDLDELMRRPT